MLAHFRNALNLGSLAAYYDLQLGEAFVKQYAEMKSGDDPAANEAIGRLMRDLARIFNYEQLEVSPDPTQTRLQYLIDGLSSYRDSELGAGVAHFILVAANVLLARPTMLLIDEPETNLHASLQLDFLNLLAESASWGVLFSTHNPGLARTGAQRTYVVSPSHDGSTVSELHVTPHLSSLLGQLGYIGGGDTTYDGVLLVEGSTDVLTFRELLRLYGKEHRFAVLSSGGSDLIQNPDPGPILEDLLRASDGRLQVCIDSERNSASAALDRHHQRFVDACQTLNIPYTVLERRSVECYFPESAVKAVFGPSARPLGPFERTKDADFGWSKAKNWKVARRTQTSDLAGTDLGGVLDRL